MLPTLSYKEILFASIGFASKNRSQLCGRQTRVHFPRVVAAEWNICRPIIASRAVTTIAAITLVACWQESALHGGNA